jgi:hypothetical protein
MIANCCQLCVQMSVMPCYLDLAVHDQPISDRDAPACNHNRQPKEKLNHSPTRSSSSGLVDLRSTGSPDGCLSSTVLEASNLLGSIEKVIKDLQQSVLSTVFNLQKQM